MTTLGERVLDAIRYAPLDDDELSRRLGVSPRQTINQVARQLQTQGLVTRYVGTEGKIVTAVADGNPTAPVLPPEPAATPGDRITEDEVMGAVRDHLSREGFDVQVAWGRTRGIDVDARHPDGRRFIIEAKAEVGHAGAQQANYFIGMLGELVQRMDDPSATYGIALPRHRQYERLVDRLPALARERLGLEVFWVFRDGDGMRVEVGS